ncbi:MAG TPA: HAMP domain-containing sensor histidine kinase [Bacteroidota bacterium]|nr:HAMP domain-containing sensor histidine kinase [Bacteroidota bacterium]
MNTLPGLRTKVALAYTLVFGVIFAAFAWLVYRNTREASIATLDASMETYAGKIEAEVQEQTGERIFPVAEEFRALPSGGLENPRYLLRTVAGRIVLDDSLIAPLAPPARDALRGSPMRETAQIDGGEWRLYSGTVEVSDTVTFLVSVAAPMTAVESALGTMRILFLFAVPAVLLLAALAAWLITRAAFAPVTAMIGTAARISARNLGDRIPLPRARDEIRLLGETLNSMIDRIEKAFDAQRRFVADASHELRTPLTIIRSELEFMTKRRRGRKEAAGLRAVAAEVDRLARMADNLLLLSRLDDAPGVLRREPLRVDEVIVECVRDMSSLYRKKGVRLDVHIDEAVEISGDREGMQRVLLNLLDNSLKFTKRGGRVRVALGRDARGDLPVHVTVEDTGCGIVPGDIPHVFRRFFRGESSRAMEGGSGLGLAIVDHLVRLQGGMIAVDSERGKGTVVSIRLPPA